MRCVRVGVVRSVPMARVPFTLGSARLNANGSPAAVVARPPLSSINRTPAAMSHSLPPSKVTTASACPAATRARAYAIDPIGRQWRWDSRGLKAADPEFPWIHEREWALRRGERSLAGFCPALDTDAPGRGSPRKIHRSRD
jgi:hypothetical protein